MNHPYDAVLFDFDGVLADSEPLHCACWAEVLKPLGISLSWQQYSKHCIGIPDAEAARYFCTLHEPPLDFDQVWSLYPAKRALFATRVVQDPPVDPGIPPLLQSLTGYRLAVVTATERAQVEPALSAAGILSYFQLVIGAEDVKETKPAPDPYLLAIRRLGIVNGLAVEDSDTGQASARAAGLDVLRVEHASQTSESLLKRLGLKAHAAGDGRGPGRNYAG